MKYTINKAGYKMLAGCKTLDTGNTFLMTGASEDDTWMTFKETAGQIQSQSQAKSFITLTL
jgi:hypothetical protein